MIILDFEKPIFELDGKIQELKKLNAGDLGIIEDVKRLEAKQKKMLKKIYSDLTPWQKVQVARHQERPKTVDYVNVWVKKKEKIPKIESSTILECLIRRGTAKLTELWTWQINLTCRC